MADKATFSGTFKIDEDQIIKKILDALNTMDDTQEVELQEGDDVDVSDSKQR